MHVVCKIIYSCMAVYSIMCRLLVSLLLTENHSGNKYAMWMQLKRFSMGWGDIWPKVGYSVQLCLLLLCRCYLFLLEGNYCLSSFIFLSCLQILTLALVWWLELPPWTQWCPASVWYLQLSPKTYRLSRRSSTAKAAPCSPPTPVSHSIMLILHRLFSSNTAKKTTFLWQTSACVRAWDAAP